MRINKKAEEIMTKEIVSVFPGSLVSEVSYLMKENDIGVVPVVSAGRLCGMITDRDIVVRCLARGKAPEKTRAEDIMSRDIAFVNTGRSVKDVMNVMSSEQVNRVPVLEDGILKGIISVSDISRKGEYNLTGVMEEMKR